MFRKIIIFGKINKKFLLPFFLGLVQILLSIISAYYPLKKNNFIFQAYNLSLGQILVRLFPLILKISVLDSAKERMLKINKCLHYFLFCLLNCIYTIVRAVGESIIFKITSEEKIFTNNNPYINNDFIVLGFEVVLLICISIFLLKYRYYKHHIISIIVFVIFGIISDIALDNYGTFNGNFFLIEFIKIIEVGIEALNFCYIKYMLEKLYIPYWNVSLVQGIFNFCFFSIIFIIILINKEKENSPIELVSSFYSYFIDTDVGLIIGKEIMEFILYIVMCVLTILVSYYFIPNFMLIIVQLSYISQNIMEKSSDKLYCIVFYIIQFIALMIHLEILELNFCGLNKNIKRRLMQKGENEFKQLNASNIIDNNSINNNDENTDKESEQIDNLFQ